MVRASSVCRALSASVGASRLAKRATSEGSATWCFSAMVVTRCSIASASSRARSSSADASRVSASLRARMSRSRPSTCPSASRPAS